MTPSAISHKDFWHVSRIGDLDAEVVAGELLDEGACLAVPLGLRHSCPAVDDEHFTTLSVTAQALRAAACIFDDNSSVPLSFVFHFGRCWWAPQGAVPLPYGSNITQHEAHSTQHMATFNPAERDCNDCTSLDDQLERGAQSASIHSKSIHNTATTNTNAHDQKTQPKKRYTNILSPLFRSCLF